MRSNEIRITAFQRGAFALVLGTAVLCGQSYSELRGDLTVLQVDPHHHGTLIGGTATAQLYRSRDGGESWESIAFPAARRSALHAIVVDPAKPDVYLVAVSSETLQYAGVFRTTDAGATWRPISGLEQKQVWALVRWNVDRDVIAAGTQEGVFLTRDGGDSWTLLSSAHSDWPKPVMSIAFDPTSLETMYAGTPHLAWKTNDGGNTWVRINRGMRDDSDIFAIDVDGARRTNLFAAACSGLYRSQDGGVTWYSMERAVGASHRTYVVARVPSHSSMVFAATNDGLIKSSDGGATWHRLSTDSARSIAFDPTDPNMIFVATTQGILRSEDGGIHFSGPVLIAGQR